jgi:hypothetical protein
MTPACSTAASLAPFRRPVSSSWASAGSARREPGSPPWSPATAGWPRPAPRRASPCTGAGAICSATTRPTICRRCSATDPAATRPRGGSGGSLALASTQPFGARPGAHRHRRGDPAHGRRPLGRRPGGACPDRPDRAPLAVAANPPSPDQRRLQRTWAAHVYASHAAAGPQWVGLGWRAYPRRARLLPGRRSGVAAGLGTPSAGRAVTSPEADSHGEKTCAEPTDGGARRGPGVRRPAADPGAGGPRSTAGPHRHWPHRSGSASAPAGDLRHLFRTQRRSAGLVISCVSPACCATGTHPATWSPRPLGTRRGWQLPRLGRRRPRAPRDRGPR